LQAFAIQWKSKSRTKPKQRAIVAGTTAMETQMDAKIELMARYLVAKGWSIWTETDAKLNELREIQHSAYDQTRHKGTQVAVKSAYVAVLQAVFAE
jgi:hypothetical protein